MNVEEANEFVKYVDGAWGPGLNEVAQKLWYDLVLNLDAKTAFTTIGKMFKTMKWRPAPPEFSEAYRRELLDSRPLATPQRDPDEMPDWVRGWRLARAEEDYRLWPEQEVGYQANHDTWRTETTWTKSQIDKFKIRSGYEWADGVQTVGITPQADRLEYVRRAMAGEGPTDLPI